MALRPGQTTVGVREKSKRLAAGIDKRIDYLQMILAYYKENKSFPLDCFIPSPTKVALREWHDPDREIHKMSVNTFMKNPHKVETLIDLSNHIKSLYDRHYTQKSTIKKSKKESITYWKRKFHDEKYKTQQLADDLLSIRALYLDLLDEISAHEQLSIQTRDALKRNKSLYRTISLVTSKEDGIK